MPSPQKQTNQELEGSVERITFHSEESGFCVLRVKVKGHRDLVTFIGNMAHVVAGEWVKAKGDWIMDKQHGRQFKTDQIDSCPPDSLDGIEKFLGSGLIKGIGPVYAKRLVEKFGRDIFDVIEHQSASLENVDGIGKGRRIKIKESWNLTRSVRAIMSFLLSHGVSTARATRIYKTYKEDAIKVMEDNPYVLARDIRGIGFKTADQIAANFGVEKNSDLRARAGVEYVLLQCTMQGHCAVTHPVLIQESERILEIDPEIIERAIDFGVTNQRLILEKRGGEDLIFLETLHRAECELVENLNRLNKGKHPCPDIKAGPAVDWAQKQVGLDFADAQKRAITAALESKVTIITGGPGVGKTTILNAIIQILAAKKLEIKLAAPTGRAAKRMAETTNRPALTLHRLLEYDGSKGAFKRNRSKPLAGDIFVIDESSMIDLPLASSLIKAIPDHAALILVGDVDQLPSVGPGTILKDLIESEQFTTEILNEVFRQAAESAIITNAHRVNRGQVPDLSLDATDFYFVPAADPDQVISSIRELVCKRIPKKFGLDPKLDIQILTPMQRTPLGARNLNTVMQAAVNPRGDHTVRFGTTYREGDKVMQTENDYDKDVYNGDIGVINKVDVFAAELAVDYQGRIVVYDFNELDELVLAYATTIHKSQGSEYPCVIIPVHTQHFVMLQRNLLYTAITRGRKLVMMVGTQKALAMAVKNIEAGQRMTTLKERLQPAPAR